MPEGEMEQILLDIHLAETYSQGLGDSSVNRFQKNYDSLAGFYTSVLRHHKLSFEHFNEALEWYKQRPERIDTLYARVLNRLNELKASAGISDLEETPPQQASPSSGVPADTAAVKKPGAAMVRNLKDFSATETDTAGQQKNKIKKPVTKSEP